MSKIHLPGVIIKGPLATAPIGTPISAPITITTPGNYYVANDFTATGSAIIIETSDVTIDLNWKTVSFGSSNGDNVHGIHAASTFTQRNNIVAKNGYLKHVGTGLSCRGVTVYGSNWELFYLAIDSNGGLFHSISQVENYFAAKGINIHHNYTQSRADYSSGYSGDVGIFLEDRTAEGYAEVHHNICAEANAGIIFSNFGLTTFPTTASLIYQNQVQTNRQKFAKSPYCLSFGRSKSANAYWNRFLGYNGRGVTADGYSSGQTDGATYITLSENAIGANYFDAEKTYDPTGLQEYPNNYGLRCRYGSHHYTANDNNVIVSNQQAGPFGYAIYIGEDLLADQANSNNITLSGNILIANDGNVSSPFAPFAWGAVADVTITNTEWQQEVDGLYNQFIWITDDPGNELGDHRLTVTETGTVAYAPTPTTPAAPTGLTLRRFFNSYVLEWTESPEEDVWQYKIYKDGIAIITPIYSSRAPHANVPKPFYVDIEEIGSVNYTVAALTLAGAESSQSAVASSATAANGWE